MIPTLSPQVADQNPKFASLYSRLTEDLLNADGTTKNRPSKEIEEDESLEKDLRSYSALLVKDELLLNALRAIELPDELQVILDLHLASVNTTNQPSIPLPPLEEILDRLPPLLKPYIELPPHSLLQLPPNTPPALAPYTVVTRLAGVQKSRLSLHNRRAELANLLTGVCNLYETYIRSIGDVIGKGGYIGKVGRMLEAKSEFLKGVAEGTEGKAGIYKYEILKAIYDEKAIEALENYRMHLIDTKSRLVAKKRQVQDDLTKYTNAGGDMKALVEKYGQILRTSDQVRADIKRLGGTPHF